MLTAAGHRVVVVGRSPAKTEAVARTAGAHRWFVADFERLDDVRRLADEVLGCCSHIDVLVNNAGGIFSGPTRTVDGYERTFQVNHLAPYLLTRRLMEVLLASEAAVVSTSSIGARLYAQLDPLDLETWSGFRPARAYGNAKLGTILFTSALHSRYHQEGLSAVAFHPGVIATNVARDASGPVHWLYHSTLARLLVTVDKGASSLAHFAGGKAGRDWASGRFYLAPGRVGRSHRQAYDRDLVRLHWDTSARMVGLAP
jgi:NAD(P)-dependent dehydrogenase (short-subunit alcohol dehydrogenase family)